MLRFAVNIFGGLHFLKRSRTYICKYGFFWLYVELFAEYNFCRGLIICHTENFFTSEKIFPNKAFGKIKNFF